MIYEGWGWRRTALRHNALGTAHNLWDMPCHHSLYLSLQSASRADVSDCADVFRTRTIGPPLHRCQLPDVGPRHAAYLQTQECWDVVDGTYAYPTQPQGTPGTPAHGTTAAVAPIPADPALLAAWREDLSKWPKVNSHAVGAIMLRLHHNLRHHCNQFAQRTW